MTSLDIDTVESEEGEMVGGGSTCQFREIIYGRDIRHAFHKHVYGYSFTFSEIYIYIYIYIYTA